MRRRFIKVVIGGEGSKSRRLRSSVPQGGKWSAPLWDFEIATLEDLNLEGILLSYADDCSLLYKIDKGTRDTVTATVSSDLALLQEWGIEWHVSFEPSKTHSLVISRKRSPSKPFDPSGINFMGKPIGQVKQMRLVGFIFDENVSMKPMVYETKKSLQKVECNLKTQATFRCQQSRDSVQGFRAIIARVRQLGVSFNRCFNQG